MKEPEDYSPEERAAMGEDFFRWRYCSVCKTDSPTTEEPTSPRRVGHERHSAARRQ